MKNQKILIIGGLGFIGSALVKKYYKDNKIIVVDNQDYKSSPLGKMNLNSDNIEVLNGDANEADFILSLDDDFDYIIHASAVLGIRIVGEQSINTIKTNVVSCLNSLDLAVNQKKLKKYITFSTSEIYGINAHDSNENDPAIIEKPLEGRWCYAASKTLAEHLCFAYHREQGINILIVRPFNVFGPYRKGTDAITTFVNKALNNETIYIDGDGSQMRSWCYIDDFINGLCIAIENSEKAEIYNIGNPNNLISITDLAKKIVGLCNSTSRVIIINSKEPDVKYRNLSIDKAKNNLHYNPNVSLDDGIKKVIEFKSKER